MNKANCDCGKMAVWCYMPSGMSGNNCFCEDCVNRGCSCNEMYVKEEMPSLSRSYPEGIENKDWKWKIEDIIWIQLDGEGKELPCCEYMYEKDGWEE